MSYHSILIVFIFLSFLSPTISLPIVSENNRTVSYHTSSWVSTGKSPNHLTSQRRKNEINELKTEDNGDARLEFRLADQIAIISGNYSTYGTRSAVNGYVVQLHPLRACDRKNTGLDLTLTGHVAVIIMDGLVEPFLAGCVSPYNQAKFALDSGAIGVIIDVYGLRLTHKPTEDEDYPLLSLPVISINGVHAQAMKSLLTGASRAGIAVTVSVGWTKSSLIKTTELFRSSTTNIFDAGILIAVLFLLIFIAAMIAVKIKWRSSRREELSLHGMAKAALSRMEVKKFSNKAKGAVGKRRSTSMNRKNNDVAQNLLESIPRLSSSICGAHETCSICLEDYRDGQTLRVLGCGHEFHKRCVDPWLLLNRTCPLCLYDVVFERYVGDQSTIPPTFPHSSSSNSVSPISNALASEDMDLVRYCGNVDRIRRQSTISNITFFFNDWRASSVQDPVGRLCSIPDGDEVGVVLVSDGSNNRYYNWESQPVVDLETPANSNLSTTMGMNNLNQGIFQNSLNDQNRSIRKSTRLFRFQHPKSKMRKCYNRKRTSNGLVRYCFDASRRKKTASTKAKHLATILEQDLDGKLGDTSDGYSSDISSMANTVRINRKYSRSFSEENVVETGGNDEKTTKIQQYSMERIADNKDIITFY